MSQSTRNKIRYNIVSQDENKIRGEVYKNNSYLNTSETNPLDTFYKYEANRNDPNLFPSGTYNETRTQIQDAVYTEYQRDLTNVVSIKESKNSFSYTQGYNTDEQKIYGYVFDYLKGNPTQTITFTEEQRADLVAKTGLNIRNIKIYGSNIGIKNSYMPATIIAPSDYQGYRAQYSSSATAYDITKLHHEGEINASLQSPFTNQHVGGYAHRHHPINQGTDNEFNRPEMVSITPSSSSISFTSPLGTTPNYNKLAIRFSRDGASKRIVNTKRIKTTDPRIAGNYSKNYEVFNAVDRNENNLWLRDNPTASFPLIDSAFISGVQDYTVQEFLLSNGTGSETIIARRFGAPGGPESNAAAYMDSTSRQFSPYNTVNYRNPTVRYYLNKQFLVNHAEFGKYTADGYGLTASFHGTQRNTNYNITSSGGIVKKYDNAFVKREIPASPRGYKTIKTRFGTGSFDNNLFVKDYNDSGITFLSKSIDRSVYFENLNLNSTMDILVKSASYSQYSSSITLTIPEQLNTYLIAKNKLMGFGTNRQLSNYYNKSRIYTRRRNYVGDTTDKKEFRYLKHPPINSKYNNVVADIEVEQGVTETISFPFASNYAYLGDYYNSGSSKLDNLYKDNRNIRYINKDESLLFKLLKHDDQVKANNIEYPKVKTIKYKEKVWPKVSKTYMIDSYSRSLLPVVQLNYSWSDNELTRTYNSLGKYNILANTSEVVTDESIAISNGTDDTAPSSGSVMKRAGVEVYQSTWPLDAFTTFSGSSFNDQSGILMTLDNPTFISSTYPTVGLPKHIRSSRSTSDYYSEYAHYGRNFNTNRPKNTVHENVNSFPLYQDLETISDDVCRNFKDYSTIPEYSPKIILSGHYGEGKNIPDNYELESRFNSLTRLSGYLSDELRSAILGGTVSNQSDGTFTIPNFELESTIYSDFIDLLPDFNKKENLNISKIKINLNVVKKFYPLLQFYPINFAAYSLAQNYTAYYVKNYTSGQSNIQPAFSSSGNPGYSKVKKIPLFYPGITFNSIKAGIGLPYCIVTSSLGNDVVSLTGSLTGAYFKAPWETVLDPSKMAGRDFYEADPDINTPISSSYKLLNGFINDKPYKQVANNFYSEIVNTFLKDGMLPRLKSKPQNTWYFPDLAKDYSMKILIFKSPDFTTYSSLESFGHRPYIFHNPPWMTTSGDATIETVTDSSFNSDVNLAPSSSWVSASYAIATLTFKPSLITASSGVQITAGKGAQISFNEIKKHTTITYESSFVTSSAIAQGAINLGDCMEFFGFSEKDETWIPYVKWACPTANLNFSGTLGKTTGSNSYDTGLSPGHAVRGIGHQFGSEALSDKGLFLQVQDNSNSATGSLAEIVGFNVKEVARIGNVANSTTFSEGLVIVPVYLENDQDEKLLEINTDKFEKNYDTSDYIKRIDQFSKDYVLPPLMDFMRVRRNSDKPLSRKDYGKVSAPFVMFFEEYKTTLSKSDLLRFWQGVIPEAASKMEIDNKVIEFDLKNNPLFSKEDLVNFGGKLPKNLRFKIFKVYKRAEKDYQNIINRTLEMPEKRDYSLSMNWPHGYYEIANMAKVEAELEYDKT